jgi:hypothetical protein
MTKHTSMAPCELGTYRNKPAPGAANWLLIPVLSVTLLLGACAGHQEEALAIERHAKAIAMWQERCKTAGEKIHKTVDGVEGIFLMKIRLDDINFGDQFKLDDPYGHDSSGDMYLLNFLQGAYHQRGYKTTPGYPPRAGYPYVEALDPKDGQRYRYTGRIEEPWQTDKSYLKGYLRFVMDKAPASGLAPRYGVTYDDISTQEERNYWIAGSSLKVVDLQTNEVIAERIGYMVDRGQGSQGGGRSPWLSAADNACPDFNRNRVRRVPGPGFSAQAGQTIDFVEKALKPAIN